MFTNYEPDVRREPLYNTNGCCGKLFLIKKFYDLWSTQSAIRYTERFSPKLLYIFLFVSNFIELLYSVAILGFFIISGLEKLGRIFGFDYLVIHGHYTLYVQLAFALPAAIMIMTSIYAFYLICKAKSTSFLPYIVFTVMSIIVKITSAVYLCVLGTLLYLDIQNGKIKDWDIIHIQYYCCGLVNYSEWGDYIPLSCCVDNSTELMEQRIKQQEQYKIKNRYECMDTARVHLAGCKASFLKVFWWLFFQTCALINQKINLALACIIYFLSNVRKGYLEYNL